MSPVFDQAFWDDLYQGRENRWSGNPNPHLVTSVTDAATAFGLTPGRALDVGAGEGGDAIWLARQGWAVTAIDISPVVLARAAENAAAAFAPEAGGEPSGSIAFERQDALAWAPPEGAFDLVSSQYGHFPTDVMHGLVRRLAAAVAPGGLLVVVGHALTAHTPSEGQGHHFGPEMFFTGAELAGILPEGFEVVSSDDRAHPAREGHDAVLVARRLP